MRQHQGKPFVSVILLLTLACADADESMPTSPDGVIPSYARPVPGGTGATVVLLPSAGGGQSQAYAINDAEEVAGESGSSAARWSRSGSGWIATRIGAAGGRATGITEAGTAVGSDGGNVMLWRRDGTSELVGQGQPAAINQAETIVVGTSQAGATAWVSTDGAWVAHSLARLGNVSSGTNEPSGVNENGIIVGFSSDASRVQHAVKWVPSTTSPGEWDAPVPIDAFAGSTNSAATGIDGDDVVGLAWRCTDPEVISTCDGRDPRHWSLSGIGSIGSLGNADAWPEGTNASRFIVGITFTRSGTTTISHAFVWSPGSPTLQTLPLPKGHSQGWAEDINNSTASRARKQVVGYAATKGGTRTAAVWTLP